MNMIFTTNPQPFQMVQHGTAVSSVGSHHASGADSTCWKPGWFLDMGDHHEQHATQIICTELLNQSALVCTCLIKTYSTKNDCLLEMSEFSEVTAVSSQEIENVCGLLPGSFLQENIRRWREGKTKIYPLEGINPSYSKSSVHSLESLLQ